MHKIGYNLQMHTFQPRENAATESEQTERDHAYVACDATMC